MEVPKLAWQVGIADVAHPWVALRHVPIPIIPAAGANPVTSRGSTVAWAGAIILCSPCPTVKLIVVVKVDVRTSVYPVVRLKVTGGALHINTLKRETNIVYAIVTQPGTAVELRIGISIKPSSPDVISGTTIGIIFIIEEIDGHHTRRK
jgi:hypothetical protein